MICRECGTDSCVWIGPLDNPDGTRCMVCGERDCHVVEADVADDEDEEDDFYDA